MIRGLGVGALAGAGWGVVARVFMRLLSDDPQFSWAGTLAIVGIAAVTGACVGLVHGARASGRSRWWRLAALPGLLLFAGPGSLLVPAAVGMAVVLRARPVLRVLGALLVVVTPVVVVSGSPTPTTTQQVGLAILVLSAAPLGWGLAVVAGRWRPKEGPTAPVDAVVRTPEAALA